MFDFPRVWILRSLISLGLLAFAALAGAGTLSAQDRRQNAPGEFDFYVLSLSWSPSFCDAAAERGSSGRSQIQCGGRPFSFVVHGLLPQYEHGFPDYCQRPSPRLDRNIMSSMLDLMPAPGLIFAEWDKHGTCSGWVRGPTSKPSARPAQPSKYPKSISNCRAEDRRAGRDRGRLHQGQSRAEQRPRSR